MHLYLYHHVGLHKRHAPMIYTWLFNKEWSDITITAKRIKALFILLASSKQINWKGKGKTKWWRERETEIETVNASILKVYSNATILHSLLWAEGCGSTAADWGEVWLNLAGSRSHGSTQFKVLTSSKVRQMTIML